MYGYNNCLVDPCTDFKRNNLSVESKKYVRHLLKKEIFFLTFHNVRFIACEIITLLFNVTIMFFSHHYSTPEHDSIDDYTTQF